MTPYSPESNGVSERYNRTIMEMVRPMLHRVGYPLEVWGEAALTACYIANRLPTSALVSGMTPFEAWHGYKPDVSHLRCGKTFIPFYMSTVFPRPLSRRWANCPTTSTFVGALGVSFALFSPFRRHKATCSVLVFRFSD